LPETIATSEIRNCLQKRTVSSRYNQSSNESLTSSAAPAVIFTKEDSEDLLNRNILIRLDVGKYLATRANIVIVLSSFNILNLFGSNWTKRTNKIVNGSKKKTTFSQFIYLWFCESPSSTVPSVFSSLTLASGEKNLTKIILI